MVEKEHDLFVFLQKKKKQMPVDQFDIYMEYVNDTIRLFAFGNSFCVKITELNFKVEIDTDAIFESVLYFLKNAEN